MIFSSSLPDLIRQSMMHRRVSMDHRVKPGGDNLKLPARSEKFRSRGSNRVQVLPIHNVKQLFPLAGGARNTRSRSRDASLHPSFATPLQESPSNRPNKTKGGGAPKGAHSLPCPAGPGARHANECCHSSALRARSPFGAPPRLSPVGSRRLGSAPGHASWDAGRAGVTRPRLSQSRDCTSRTGRSTGVNDAREPPGNGLRDRPREPHLLHLLGRTRNVPFDEQALIRQNVSETATIVNTIVTPRKRRAEKIFRRRPPRCATGYRRPGAPTRARRAMMDD